METATDARPTDARLDPPEVFDVFARLGRAQRVGAGTPFLLTGDEAWLVEEGAVDVFAVALLANEPVGARAHLLRAGPGAVLLAVDDAHAAHGDLAERGLLAVGASGTLLRRLALGDLRAHGETVDG
ncbi:MAG TPA: hypothetical protein VF048_04665, partial [Gemmatimonadaceae bacterium]